MTETEGQTLKVKRTTIAPRLTCPLCLKFYRDATTISECLHTFCRECIWKKFRDERQTHCPVCNKDLGCYPLDRTRPDHNLQDLRDKIFPHEDKSPEAPEPEPVPSFPLPSNSKKKDRSLSLVGSSPPTKLSSHYCLVERRAKTAAKKFLDEQESAFAAFELEKRSTGKKHGRPNGVEILEGSPKNLSRAKSVARKKYIPKDYIPFTSQPQPQKVAEDNKTAQERSQLETENVTSEIENQKTSLEPDLNQQKVTNETSEKNSASWKGKAPMWEPLNCLTEAPKNVGSIECNNMQEDANVAGPVETCNHNSDPTKILVAIDQKEATEVQPDPFKAKGLRKNYKRRVKFALDLNVPAEPVLALSSSQSNKRTAPIWFSLIASEENDVRARLPQLPSRYLRVKDANLPVAFIKKYIVSKLDFAMSEAEVEVSLRGKPLLPSLELKDIADMWLETVPKSETNHSFVGDSAKDFVMVLSYGRKT